MIMQLAQQMGLMPQSSAFGGHNDMLLHAFGMPTSAGMPGMYDINSVGFLGRVRQNYLDRGEDYSLRRVQEATGIGNKALDTMMTLFPTMQKFMSSRTDMLGGSYAFAQSMNPVMATSLQGGQEARDGFKVFQDNIYKKVFAEGGSYDSFKGIRNERDVGSILTYASQTGQMRQRSLNAKGEFEKFESADMEKAAEDVLDNFDQVLAAGRRIFGPNAPAKQVLQQMQQLGGDVHTKEGGAAMAETVERLAMTAANAGANVGAVMKQTANNAQRLQQMGVDSRLSREVAIDGSEYAVRAQQSSRAAGQFFAENGGINLPSLNFQTAASAYMQNRMRWESRSGNRSRIARMAARNMGFQSEEAAGIFLADKSFEFLQGQLTDGQRATLESDFEAAVGLEVASDNYTTIRRAAIAEGDIDINQLDAFQKARHGMDAKTAARMSYNIRTVNDKNVKRGSEKYKNALADLQKAIGGDPLTENTLDAMLNVEMTAAAETSDILLTLNPDDLDDKKYASYIEEARRKKDPVLAYLERKKAKMSEQGLDRLKDNENVDTKVLTEAQVKAGGLSDFAGNEKELKARGIFQESYLDNGELKDRYIKVTAKEGADATAVDSALESANNVGIGAKWGGIMEEFFRQLEVFVQGFVDKENEEKVAE